MIKDQQTQFSGSQGAAGNTTGQVITATAISSNVLDLRNGTVPSLVDDALDGDSGLYLVVQALTAAAGGDAAKTLTITLESDSTGDLATAPIVHSVRTVTGAQITLGAILWSLKLPSDDYKRYLGLRYTVSAGFTAFNLAAYLTPAPARNVIYPNSFAVV